MVFIRNRMQQWCAREAFCVATSQLVSKSCDAKMDAIMALESVSLSLHVIRVLIEKVYIK